MSIVLNKYSVYGTLDSVELDQNWINIEGSINLLLMQIPQDNVNGLSAPTLNDDETQGYSVGSRWVDNSVSPRVMYWCIRAAEGAADWITSEIDYDTLGSAAAANLGTGPSDVPQNSDLGSMAYETASDYVLKTVTITAGDGLTDGGALSGSITINVDVATATNIWAGAANKMVAAAEIYTSQALQTSSVSTDFQLDFQAGRNFQVTLTGDAEMQNPANQVAGQSGLIYIVQDGTGGHTLTFGGNFDHVLEEPTLDETAGVVHVFSYFVKSAGNITLSYIGPEA